MTSEGVTFGLNAFPAMKVQAISWTGCPAANACYHHRDNDRGKRKPTALCRACDGALRKMLARGWKR